jgi:hypothetical protein
MSAAEQLRISQIARQCRNAQRLTTTTNSPPSDGSSAGAAGRWWTYDLTESSCDPELRGKREILANEHSTTLISNRFDYLALGPELRQEYMLPADLQPEPWQLQMFAQLRQKKSLVVIAPTSSGKTMSAEYAMRISATTPGNGVGVFVLPTNALVRQAYATLSTDPFIPRNSVAMFTSERRDNFDGHRYKILVTNPQCLHILIFSNNSSSHPNPNSSSPSSRFSTTPFFQRINCVVIDEVHCIGATAQEISSGSTSAGSGVIIERLLCMLQCPVVCLSATLANARQFLAWLRELRSRDAAGDALPPAAPVDGAAAAGAGVSDVEIIEHHERSTALHFYSMGFDRSQKPQLVDAQATHQIGSSDLRLLCETEGTCCVITGQWSIPLPEPLKSGRSEEMAFCHFRDTITKCVMLIDILLDFGQGQGQEGKEDEGGFGGDSSQQSSSFQLQVKILPHRCHPTYLMGAAQVTYNDDPTSSAVLGSPISIDFTSSHLHLPFRFLVEPNRNQIVFEIGSIKSPSLQSAFPPSPTPSSSSSLQDPPAPAIVPSLPPLFTLSSMELSFSTLHKNYNLSSITAFVKQTRRPLTLLASLDPNAIPSACPIDLNPLAFLPRITFEDSKVLSDFLTASPSLQPHHLVETFDSLYTSLSSLPQESLNLPPLQVPSQLINLYDSLARDAFDPTDLETFAFYRARYTASLQQLHDVIFRQNSLVLRLLLDHMMARIFLRDGGLDWYGKLYHTTDPIPVQLNASLNWQEELEGALEQLSSLTEHNLVISCLCQATRSLAFSPTGAGAGAGRDGGGNGKVTLKNIFALDASLKYVLSLLLRRGDEGEEATEIPATLRMTIMKSLNDSNAVRLRSLRQLGHQQDQNPVGKKEVFSVMQHFINQEDARAPSQGVQSPTLIFHFSKRGIDAIVEPIIENPSLWLGDHANDNHLSGEDIDRIKALPKHRIRDTERKALLLGIGMHYRVAKGSEDYLAEVEYLFQSRKLKFVFATGSLSYGINMPAANVVFLGASPFLDGLMFRQCAGRAGRRGFGAGVGKVFFVGFGVDSIVRKMCMPLDHLRPQLAISASYLLSSSILRSTCSSDDAPWIHQLIMRTLTEPLYKHLITSSPGLPSSSPQRDLFDTSLAHSCLFTWSFLNQRGYLQANGTPTLKCSLQNRLHYLEPQCFILTELLTECVDPTLQLLKGTSLLDLVPEELIQREGKGEGEEGKVPEEVREEKHASLVKDILSLLNHLLSQSGTNRSQEAAEIPLNPIVTKIWSAYSTKVTAMFVKYLRGIGVNLTEASLPLTDEGEEGEGGDVSGEGGGPGRVGVDYHPILRPSGRYDHLQSWLQQTAGMRPINQPLVRSAYASLSSPEDNFESIEEMTMVIKDGLFVSEKIIPSRDRPAAVHIRVEYVFFEKTFKGLKEMYRDIDAPSQCEQFSKAARCVRAFVRELLAHENHLAFSPRAKILFRAIDEVVTTFERHLEMARNQDLD